MKAYMKMHNSDEINRIQDMPLDRINTTIDGDEASLPLGELDDVSGGTSKTNREQYSGIVVEALVCTNFKVFFKWFFLVPELPQYDHKDAKQQSVL